MVVERESNLFDSGIPLTYQINGELAVVTLRSEQVYLDPGTRFAPFGWIPWWKLFETAEIEDVTWKGLDALEEAVEFSYEMAFIPDIDAGGIRVHYFQCCISRYDPPLQLSSFFPVHLS